MHPGEAKGGAGGACRRCRAEGKGGGRGRGGQKSEEKEEVQDAQGQVVYAEKHEAAAEGGKGEEKIGGKPEFSLVSQKLTVPILSTSSALLRDTIG